MLQPTSNEVAIEEIHAQFRKNKQIMRDFERDFPSSLTAGPGCTGGHVPVTVLDRTDAITRGISVLLNDHKAGPQVIASVLLQTKVYLNGAANETVWVKRCKYLLCLPLSLYLRSDQPPIPDKDFNFAGIAQRWIRNRLKCFNRKNTHLWYSWFQLKRCALPCSEDFVDEVYNDHFKSLSSDDVRNDEAIDAAFNNPTFEWVLRKVRKELNFVENSVDRRPSVSACYDATRAQGGQFASLKRAILRELYGEDVCSYNYMSFTTELSEMVECSRIFGSDNRLFEIRQPEGFQDWVELASLHSEYRYDSPLRAIIQAVIEPLKVRVISKGESLPYYCHIDLQKRIHGILRKMSCFKLLDRPFCPTDMVSLKKQAPPGSEWFSIDYSAATDGLSWRFSELIMRYILHGNVEPDRPLRVLGPHLLSYPVKGEKGKVEERGLQRRGQLMGSILSFPILCLANLATYLLATNEFHIGWSPNDVLDGVLINGDDMLYAAPLRIWERHKKVAGDLGLQMSVGKAYHHPVYANVNSTSIHYNLLEKDSPYQVDYLNLGLFFNSEVQKKKGKDEKDLSSKTSFVSSINALLKGCRTAKSSRSILSSYLRRFEKEIKKECTTDEIISTSGRTSHWQHERNLFLPCSRGGMGVVAPLGWKYKISPIDRRLAHCEDHYDTKPLPGYQVSDMPSPVSPWVKPQVEAEIKMKLGPQKRKKDTIPITWPIWPWDFNASVYMPSGPLPEGGCRNQIAQNGGPIYGKIPDWALIVPC